MELRNINTFLKAAATQNFSKAAEQLGYSQSAVTVQIRQLEKELGTPLFERIGKRVSLTERGMEFTSYANEIMRVTDQARFFAKDQRELDGTLRIGGVESVWHCAFARFAVFFLCTVSKSEDYHKIRNNPGTDGDGKKQ